MRILSRTTLALTAAAAIATFGIAAPAHAAPPAHSNAPSASAMAGAPAGQDVTITYDLNRGAQAVADQVCELDGGEVPCDDVADSTTKKASTYSVDLTGLSVGDHVFTVTFVLTDGGTASASAEFTIEQTLEEACAYLTGILTTSETETWVWKCIANPYTGSIPTVIELVETGIEVLTPYCPSGDFAGSFASAPPLLGEWYCNA
ncbi:hypothetical protein [Agromyces binzhouensis]|uniref:Ig-like domain repeat protein n=1 Tax=Agromyces binzhouensis TaxID=1817495 RepID=A0A4Q2JT62_9MICO|nr:hypothetical protein [Agromyces binzhouensis]RXZ50246.1 hypothetical protein ESO86_02905 [Agromyces binzhouensis]